MIRYGVLPKKSFSLGLAEEKRYYFECRLLVEAEDDEPEAEPEENTEDAVTIGTETPESTVEEDFDDGLDVVQVEFEDDMQTTRKPRRGLFGRRKD